MVEDVINEPRTSDSRECPVCQAPLHPGTARCWLCGVIEAHRSAPRADEMETTVRPAGGEDIKGPAPPRPQHHAEIDLTGSYSLASLMMFVTLASVVLGVATQWPGVGVPLGILAFIIWTRTANVVRYRVAEGRAVTNAQKIHIFLSSFAGTVVVLALVALTGAAALGTACAAMVSTFEPRALWFVVLGAVVLVVGVFALKRIFQYINSRAK